MQFAQVQPKITEALATGDPYEKLRALELANEYDQQRQIRIVGSVVIGICFDEYTATPGALRIRGIDERALGYGTEFIGDFDKRVFDVVRLALGSSYGVSVENPDSMQAYIDAARMVDSTKYRTRADVIGPPKELVDIDALAKGAHDRRDSVMKSDFTQRGTAYFRDAMHVISVRT
jgi:hypothetical protein